MRIWRLALSKKHTKNLWFSRSTSKKIMIKTLTKTCLFSLAFFTRFWEGFGRCFGGVLGLFCVTWGNFFQFARTFLDFFLVWQRKLSKLTRCGGLEALKGVFWRPFWGYLAWKGVKFGSILTEKVDRRREWHAKFNQGVIGRSLVKKL